MVEDNETTDADTINATPADPAANSYCTILRMNDLTEGISSKLSEKWNALGVDEQERVLKEGTRLIDQFRHWGVPYGKDQALSFPRKIDRKKVDGVWTPFIDPRVERALLEYVKYRADGRQVAVKNLQKESVTSQSIGGQTASQRPDITELPAGTKRELLKIARSYWTSAKGSKSYGRCIPTNDDGSLFG